MKTRTLLWLAALTIGCGSETVGNVDAGDGSMGADSGGTDAGSTDAGSPDEDAGPSDGGSMDGGMTDGGSTDGGTPPAPCTTNATCASTEFCAAPLCGAMGVCTLRPVGCPDFIDPVCGCDGITYGNACDAAAAGVNVAMRGACPTGCTLTPADGCCFDDSNCTARGRCVGEACTAGSEGTCVPNVLSLGECWEDTDCNSGETCEGEQICRCGMLCVLPDAPGRCMRSTPTSCTDNTMCGATDYCAKRDGDCAGTGECTLRPRFCPLFFDPVCGCDGNDYSNACDAASAGVNVASRGMCPRSCDLVPSDGCCFDDADCSTRGGRCLNESCRSNAEGTCVDGTLRDGQCWEDSDCSFGGVCTGARICPCGGLCPIADAPGSCAAIGF